MATAQYIPGLVAVAIVLLAYKLLGAGSGIYDTFSKKSLDGSYDYVISE